MTNRVNRNIDWVADDVGDLLGYSDRFGNRTYVPRIAYDAQGNPIGLVGGPDRGDPLAALGAEVSRLSGPAFYARPQGFDWAPPVSVWSVGAKIETDFDPAAWMVPATATLWVSVARGVDSTGDGSFATPYKSIAKAITEMTGPTTIYVEAGFYDRNFGWKTTSPQHNCNVIGVGGPVVSSQQWEGGAWTLTTNGTYQAARSAAGGVIDRTDITAFGTARQLKKVATQALCEAEARTWATNGTNVWVHTFDGRSPDANVAVMIDQVNGYMAHDKKVFCRGIEFEGGSFGFSFLTTALTAAAGIVCTNCKFTYARVNGWSALGIKNVILHKCQAFGNLADGLNYHKGSNNISPYAVEIDCTSYANGDPTDTADNDNGSTTHGDCRILRVGTVVDGTHGPGIVDIDQAQSWNIGCFAGASAASNVPSQNTGFQALGTASMWLDGCVSAGSANRASIGSTAQMFARRSDVGAVPAY